MLLETGCSLGQLKTKALNQVRMGIEHYGEGWRTGSTDSETEHIVLPARKNHVGKLHIIVAVTIAVGIL